MDLAGRDEIDVGAPGTIFAAIRFQGVIGTVRTEPSRFLSQAS